MKRLNRSSMKTTRIHQLFFSGSVGGVAAAITKSRPPLEHSARGTTSLADERLTAARPFRERM